MKAFVLPLADRPNQLGVMHRLSLQWLPASRHDLVFVLEPEEGGQRRSYPVPITSIVDLLDQDEAEPKPVGDGVAAGTEYGGSYLAVQLKDFPPFNVHHGEVKDLLRKALMEVTR